MTREKLKINIKLIDALKTVCVNQFSKSINTMPDIVEFKDSILENIGVEISTQTLRRFFNLVHYPFQPSVFTLNCISSYCGFYNWESFCNTQKKDSNKYNKLTLQEEKDIYLDFFNIEIPKLSIESYNKAYYLACRNIFKRLFKNLTLFNLLIPYLLKNEAGISYGIERFINMNGLCKGFDRTYHLYLQKKKTGQEQIFANSLLFLEAILTNNLKMAKLYLKKINTFSINESNHPFVYARYLGSNLLFHYKTNDYGQLDYWINQIENIKKENPNKLSLEDYKNEFEFMICEYLALTNLNTLLIKYLVLAKSSFTIMSDNEYKLTFWNRCVFYEKIAKLKSGKKIKISEKDLIASSEFTNELYIKLLYKSNLLEHGNLLPKEIKKIKVEIKTLVEKTGITYFTN